MRAHSVTTPAAIEPLSLEDAKLHLRVDHDNEDLRIAVAIQAARSFVEAYTHRALISRTIETRFDGFGAIMCLPWAPLVSVTSVSYIDSSGDLTVAATSLYDVDTFSEPGRITLAYSQTWPTPRAEPHSVRIIHVSGYGTAAENVDPLLLQAVYLMTSHFYETREPIVIGTITSEVPFSVKSMLDPYRVTWV